MSIIRKLTGRHLDDFIAIAGNAYPILKLNTVEDRLKFRDRLNREDKALHGVSWGLFREGRLRGGMRTYDFNISLFAHKIAAGGVGLVAVDLPYKKEKICKELVAHYIRQYRERNAPLALLWPFRPDFYRKMGFGYGAKLHQYRVKPSAIPAIGPKNHVVQLGKKDIPALQECYARYCMTANGLAERTSRNWEMIFDMFPALRLFGHKDKGKINGYMIFHFEPAHPRNYVCNDMLIREFIHETPAALAEMLTFLNSQADQINTIAIETTDDDFHHIFIDARNQTNNLTQTAYHESHASFVGIMYRVLDTARLLKELADHNFGSQSCRMKLTIRDSLIPENSGSLFLEFDNGRVEVKTKGKCDFEVTTEISDFSSLILGAVGFGSLCRYGRAEISDPKAIGTAAKIFAVESKPHCLTSF